MSGRAAEISEETRVPLKLLLAVGPLIGALVAFFIHDAIANSAQDARINGLEAHIDRLETIVCAIAEGQHLLIPECDEKNEKR